MKKDPRIFMILRNLFLTATALLFAGACYAKTTFKVATLSPKGSSWMQLMEKGAEEIATKTDGRVQFKFYPGGIMGSDELVLKKIRIGQLQGGAVTSGSLANLYPANQVYSLPMQFDSLAQVDNVRAQFDDQLLSGLQKKGLVSFGYAGGGFAYLMSKSPIKNLEDLKTSKVWAPDSKLSIESLKAFGIRPVTLGIADVLPGLQTGLIDTVATSPVAAIALQWHTQIKHVMKVPLAYIYAQLVVSKKAFKKMAAGDQDIVKSVMAKTFAAIQTKNRDDNKRALEALGSLGIKVTDIAAADFKSLKKRAHEVHDLLIEKNLVPKTLGNAVIQATAAAN